MRRTQCRPGVNDIRCKYIERNPYAYLFEQPAPVQAPRTTTAPPQEKPIYEAEKQDKRKEQTQSLVKPAPIAKPTQEYLTEEQITKAKLAKASDIFHKEGADKAESYLNDNDLNYTIDWQLSNDSGLVLIDNNTGRAVVAYRGTDISSPADWITGISMLRNEEAQNSVFKDGKVQMEQVIQEYGAPQELIGFSRGGTLAMTLGNEFGVNTTTFNPFVNKNLATTLFTDANHTIIRTTTDPVSIGANLPNPKFKVVQIAPKETSLNPMTNHELVQFLDNDTPRRQPPIENLQRFVELTGKAQSELITIKDMGQAIRQGKSFTEFLSEFSPVDVAGGLSSRIYEGSNFTNWWRELGGSFNQLEVAHLATTPRGSTTETGTTAQHRAEFGKLSPAEQDAKIAEQSELHMKALERFNDFQSGQNQVQEIIEPTVTETVTEQLSGASLASGFIGSYVGGKIVEKLDPQQKLKVQGDEAVSGFLGGGIGALLAGGAILPSAIAGSAGLLAGAETSRALQRAGVSKTGSATIGGAVGGATAGAVAVGVGVGASALSGAEIGSAFAPETFGLSIAIGAGIGALAGLGASLWNDAFGDSEPPPDVPLSTLPANVFTKTQLRAPKTNFSTPPEVLPAPQPMTEQPPLPPPIRPPMTSTMGRSMPVPRAIKSGV